MRLQLSHNWSRLQRRLSWQSGGIKLESYPGFVSPCKVSKRGYCIMRRMREPSAPRGVMLGGVNNHGSLADRKIDVTEDLLDFVGELEFVSPA